MTSEKYETTTGRELEYCVACRFDAAHYRKYSHTRDRKAGGGAGVNYEDMLPVITRDKLSGAWMVHCPNCGLYALWGAGRKGSVSRWNSMARMVTYLTPDGPVPFDRLRRADGSYCVVNTRDRRPQDDLVRILLSIERDGRIRKLRGTDIRGHVTRQRTKMALLRRLVGMGYKGRFHLRWTGKGLFFAWKTSDEIKDARAQADSDPTAQLSSSLPLSFHREIRDVGREVGIAAGQLAEFDSQQDRR